MQRFLVLEEHEYFVVRVAPIFKIWVEKISEEKKVTQNRKETS